MPRQPTKKRKPAVYRVDGDPDTDGTLAAFKRANRDAPLTREQYATIGSLPVGGKVTFTGGAWAEFTVKRIR